MSGSEEDKQLQDARIGFQAAQDLVALTSQEIYGRFNAMLTANSIIVAILGWIIASERSLPCYLAYSLPSIGLVLCILWYLFNEHGVYWQTTFRNEARRLEDKYFKDTFSLFRLRQLAIEDISPPDKKFQENQSSRVPKRVSWFPYRRTSTLVIIMFLAIYIIVLIETT